MIFIKILKNITKKTPRQIFIIFDEMIADMLGNKKLNPIVNELFIRRRKLNILLFLLHNLISLFQKILD